MRCSRNSKRVISLNCEWQWCCDVLLCVQLVRSRAMHCLFQTTVCLTTFTIRSCAHHTARGMTQRQQHVSIVECRFAASPCCSLVALTDSAELSSSVVLIVPPVSFLTDLYTLWWPSTNYTVRCLSLSISASQLVFATNPLCPVYRIVTSTVPHCSSNLSTYSQLQWVLLGVCGWQKWFRFGFAKKPQFFSSVSVLQK